MPLSSFRFFSPSFFLLLWISFVHLAGLYLFTSGFLLTRLALTNVTSCIDGSCTLPVTHKRAVVLIIDSLRFDFIAPAPFIPSPNSTEYSVHHHSVLTLPSLLTNAHPRNSFIFNSYPDPPTTTLQRIKGLTTGSLPTFVDLGSNFGGSEIEEDSIIGQVGMKGGKVAFMGDDTWMTVFPDAFHVNMTWPYDSFNVEDLHTVDNGVITHLFPLLESGETPDLIIGHFLGVDHVGHRVGPFHPSMHSKLQQMNATLSRVVDLLPDDTLLVVLGDHGMDRAGDHGGDGELETSAAVWVYSKGVQLFDDHIGNIPSQLVPHTTFPNAESPYRHIQQIDLVSTLSLLLGLPIPFNNLGSVIPELFWRKPNPDSPVAESWSWGGAWKNSVVRSPNDPLLARALQLNALQIHAYLETYRASGSGAELDDAWIELETAWDSASKIDARDHGSENQNFGDLWNYTRLALRSCRSMWAQFNSFLMILGLILLSTSLLATYTIYTGIRRVVSSSPTAGQTVDWEDWVSALLWPAVRGSAGGATLGFLASFSPGIQGKGVDSLDCILFMAPFTSCIMVAIHSAPKNHTTRTLSMITMSDLLIILPFILHVLAFFSNSFTFWEDRIVAFLLPSSLVVHILTGLRAPTARLRRRVLGFAGLTVLCVRLMAVSTVCREEQHPYCHVTFYSSASSTLESEYTSAVVPPSASSSFAPLFALLGAPVVALGLPRILRFFLRQSKSDQGLASVWFSWVMTPSLVCGTGYWLIEYAETAGVVDESEWGAILRFCRTFLARAAFGWPTIVGGALWWYYPLCISVQAAESSEGQPTRQITLLGFANAYGAPYLLFWTIPFSLAWASTQLTGQIVLGLSAVAVLSYLEVLDGVRDVKAIEDAFASNKLSELLQSREDEFGATNQAHDDPPKLDFSEIFPLILLGLHSFFRTGHQSTISSIQWKSAFLLSSTVTYPWSPGTAILNSFGPLWVVSVGAGLTGVWLKAPRFSPSSQRQDKKSKQDVQPTTPAAISINDQIQPSILLCCLCLSMYFLAILLTTSLSAAILRRHLMVWKVFAPRWMLGVVGVLVGDVSTLTIYFGIWRVKQTVNKTLSRIMPGRG